jgi:hypothetical protein
MQTVVTGGSKDSSIKIERSYICKDKSGADGV